MEVAEASQGLSAATRAHAALERINREAGTMVLTDMSARTTHILSMLKASLNNIGDLKRGQKWIESIHRLLGEARMPRIVIGVMGDTGAGKSSLINAVVDEERIVPTSCMRACTAVITEISWNHSNDPTKKYRAEIEFITQADWDQHVTNLHGDICQPDADIRDVDTSAGMAFAILHAVYPNISLQEMKQTNPHTLANKEAVREIIGNLLFIEKEECGLFYDEIQRYVDSEVISKGKASRKNVAKKMAYWPLIKVVRVFLKSEILSSGVCLVDLPGTYDTNPARAAMAESYMKECTRIWIVAPIQRAVNDKKAKHLMGCRFKQQLKLDDAYSTVTFICTKADDITVDEAAKALGIEDENSNDEELILALRLEINSKKNKYKKQAAKKAAVIGRLSNVRDELAIWIELQQDILAGHRVYAPRESARKRKRTTASAASKRMKLDGSSSDTDEHQSTDDENDDNNDIENIEAAQIDRPEAKILTSEDTNSKINKLKDEKKSLQEAKKSLVQAANQVAQDIKELKEKRLAMKNNMYRRCIQGRNEYSRSEIRQDFASGLKELDQELLAEQEEAGKPIHQKINPKYEEAGNALPVFCISSRAFQKLRGRMKKDKRPPGFTSLEETEVLALRQHTLDMVVSTQGSHVKRHLRNVFSVLRDMDLFVAGDAAAVNLSEMEKEQESKHLAMSLVKLRKALGEAAVDFVDDTRAAIENAILRRMPTAIAKASSQAVTTAEIWGKKPDVGGLRFGTYRATCRYRGAFKGSTGMRDFNDDLLRPLQNHIAFGWDQTFNAILPSSMDSLAASWARLITAFNERMKGRPFIIENGDLSRNALITNIASMSEQLDQVAVHQKQMIRERQRDASRALYPAIQLAMRHVYSRCSQESGYGAFANIKRRMKDHIEAERGDMFQSAALQAEDCLSKMLKDLSLLVLHDVNSIIETLENDYTSLIGTVASKADTRARKALEPVLEEFYEQWLLDLDAVEQIAAASEQVDMRVKHTEPDAQESDEDSE